MMKNLKKDYIWEYVGIGRLAEKFRASTLEAGESLTDEKIENGA